MALMNKRQIVIAVATLMLGTLALLTIRAEEPRPPGISADSAIPIDQSVDLSTTLPTPSAAERGRYLAIAGNCATCHTPEGSEPFSGGVAFATAFGTIYSTNISQDKSNGIGAWSLEDFRKAMRKGVRPDGKHLYPAFPYTAFTKLNDADIAALFAYMKTLAPVDAPDKENDLKFPFNWRGLLRIWNFFFLQEGIYQEDSRQSVEWNRGAYLVESLGHCSMCHSPRNFLGAEKSNLSFTGGTYNDKIFDGTIRPWSAVNLTSAKTGLGHWSSDELFSYLKTGISERATTFGPMNDVVMNSTRHLGDADLRAIAAYIKALPANTQSSGGVADQATLTSGESVYTVHCGSCHLPTGRGDDNGGQARIGIAAVQSAPLAGSAIVQAADPASLINVILYSPQLPPPPFTSGRDRMPAFVDKLSDEEVAQVSSYVRASWGNAGSAVTAEQVVKQR